jgi:hypothetical protein
MIGLVDRLARALGGEAVPAPVPVPDQVAVVRSRLIPAIAGRLSGMGTSAAAVTLGRTILVAPEVEATARLLRHELAHVRQWERRPYAFPFCYIAAHIRHGYGSNPFEAEARAAETGQGISGEGT